MLRSWFSSVVDVRRLEAVVSVITVLISGVAVLVSSYAARNSSRAAEASLDVSQAMLNVEVIRHDVTALTTIRARFGEVSRFVDQPVENEILFIDQKLQYYETVYSPYKDYFSPEFQEQFECILDERRYNIEKRMESRDLVTRNRGSREISVRGVSPNGHWHFLLSLADGTLDEPLIISEHEFRVLAEGVLLVEEDGFTEISDKLSEKLAQLAGLIQ